MSRKKSQIEGEILYWRCGSCDTWSSADSVMCEHCGAPHDRTASAYRLQRKLGSEEKLYYTVTAPQMLQELRAIRRLLEEKDGN